MPAVTELQAQTSMGCNMLQYLPRGNGILCVSCALAGNLCVDEFCDDMLCDDKMCDDTKSQDTMLLIMLCVGFHACHKKRAECEIGPGKEPHKTTADMRLSYACHVKPRCMSPCITFVLHHMNPRVWQAWHSYIDCRFALQAWHLAMDAALGLVLFARDASMAIFPPSSVLA